MKYFFVFWAVFFSLQLKAHQPDVSTTMLVEQKPDVWVLQIRAALTAFEFEINTHFGDTAYKTPEAFQALVIQHVKSNVSILCNEQDHISLSNPHVKLGHETNVIFEVLGMPKDIRSLYVKNSSFKDIHRNQSGLLLLKNGFAKKQVVLNNKNKHQANLKVDKSGKAFINSKANNSASIPQELATLTSPYSIYLGIFVLFMIGFICLKFYKIKMASIN